MRSKVSRRGVLAGMGMALAGFASVKVVGKIRTTFRRRNVAPDAAPGYDPMQHKWLMALDVERCIGCGLCVEACRTENNVPEGYFRTWIERYVVQRPPRGSGEVQGQTLVDSPDGGQNGFPPTSLAKEEILKAFFVPKLCNLCETSPCVQACPVGATFDTPDGVALVDPNYCIGCGFCIQACPYGCRFMSPVTKTAEKCTLCYHRITRGFQPACVEICPTQARIFGDLKHPLPDDPLQRFIEQNRVQSLRPHLGTGPRVLYAGLDKEVR
jgi:Fe-S-cluster-containing dehydrogenase component